MSTIVLTLPDNLAQEAEANGLLRPESMAALLARRFVAVR